MADKALGLQDNFLNHLRRAKTPVTIFLVKGVKLQGIITWFDSFSLLLRREGSAQLVYKHSISTIMPAQIPDGFVAPETNLQSGEGRRPALQDLFLGASVRQHEAMTVFLVNGVMLTGEVGSFDQFCLLLERGGLMQLVYKHAVSTLQPTHPLSLDNEPDAEDGD
jgi:host factor-I protein